MKNEKTELKWYEKKAGLKIKDKINTEEKKKKKEERSFKKNNREISSIEFSPKKSPSTIKFLDTKSLFSSSAIPQDAKDLIENFNKIVSSSHPLSSKQKVFLAKHIRDLSHNLTDERGNRRIGYMNETTALSAYVHYFMWWNLVRLTRLFSNMDKSFFDSLTDESICLDIGSGPLTVVTALFLSRPELRNKKLTWYCMDLSSQALAFGEDIFLSVAARLQCEPWKIIRVKGNFGSSIKQKADLVTTANLFNELQEKSKPQEIKNSTEGIPPDYLSKIYTDRIQEYLNQENDKASVIVIEPGDPRSARLISLMRASFMRKKFFPTAPCTHCNECPMEGKKGGKWCNFAFTTEDAPRELKKLSERSELPKERAVLSFVAVKKQAEEIPENGDLSLRITSDLIRLPGNRSGFYACSKKGLILLVTDRHLHSGDCIKIEDPKKSLRTDPKTSALIIE